MSKPSKQYFVLNSDGSRGFISASRAKSCIDKGYAIEVRPRVVQFRLENPAPVPSKPCWGPSLSVIHRSVVDSGQVGFLAYPQPCGTSVGPKFPGLFREGAGL